MNLENKHWDLADRNLSDWLNGDNRKAQLPISDLLKSAYLIFRQKEKERLSHFCKKAIEYCQEREMVLSQRVKEAEYRDDGIRYRLKYQSQIRVEKPKIANQRIITGILSGDYNVFYELYVYEFPKVVKLITRNSGSLEMAQDVFQDAIVILMEKVYAKKLNLKCSIKTYLYSICKILWFDQLRQHNKERQLLRFYDEYDCADEISIPTYTTPDVFENVASAINSLGDPCRKLLECFYYKNMSWKEIASSLGYVNAASARNQKYKCLERIKNKVSTEAE